MAKTRKIFLALTLAPRLHLRPVQRGRLRGHCRRPNRDADHALQMLTRPIHRSGPREIGQGRADSPNIIKAVWCSAKLWRRRHGEDRKVVGYYNSFSASWACKRAQSYVCRVSDDDKAVNYVARNEGWEIGVGPTVVRSTRVSPRIYRPRL